LKSSKKKALKAPVPEVAEVPEFLPQFPPSI